MKSLKENHAETTSVLRGRIEKIEAQNSELGEQVVALLKFMGKQYNARSKMFYANTLVDFIKKVFLELRLNYPCNMEEVKDTKKKTRYA